MIIIDQIKNERRVILVLRSLTKMAPTGASSMNGRGRVWGGTLRFET